jgi:hypothetical protein
MLPNGEGGTFRGVALPKVEDDASAGLGTEFEGIAAGLAAGEDELFLRASIRFRINSVVFAFFCASVSG